MKFTTIRIEGAILSADIIDKIELSFEGKSKFVPNFLFLLRVTNPESRAMIQGERA
jgi:hypothetical protein